jgi:hypothetical protein
MLLMLLTKVAGANSNATSTRATTIKTSTWPPAPPCASPLLVAVAQMRLLVLVHLWAIQGDDQLRLTPWFGPDIQHQGGLALPTDRGVAHHHHDHDGEPPGGGAGSPSPACKVWWREKKAGTWHTR